MKRVVLLIIGVVLLVTGCSNPATPAKEITECDAVSIARQVVPARIANTPVIAIFHPQSEEPARWSIVFPVVNITLEELGWWEDENTHLIWSDENSFAGEMPPDTYRNVIIYIDAVSGNIIGQEANNEIILGEPGMFSNCP